MSEKVVNKSFVSKLENVKSSLAKIMSAENITVIHSNKELGAKFDAKNRILYLPVFKGDISLEMYDLFVGHEVGHALFTENDKTQKILNNVLNKFFPNSKNNKQIKDYVFASLNAIEDARIEKLIKRRYPGLNRAFNIAYIDAINDNFFPGLTDKPSDPDEKIHLLDRINREFKVGKHIPQVFSDEEKPLVQMVAELETLDDVENCLNKIFEYLKTPEQPPEPPPPLPPPPPPKKSPKQKPKPNGENNPGEDKDENESSSGSNDSDKDENEDKSDEKGDKDSEESSDEGSNENETDGEEDDGDEEEDNADNKGAPQSTPQKGAGQDLEADMQIFANLNNQSEVSEYLQKFIDKNATEYCYFSVLEFSKNDYEKFVIKPEVFIAQCASKDPHQKDLKRKNAIAFKNKVKATTAFLTKEFLIKKSAAESIKDRIEKTGILCTTKMHKFKYHEDIFKRRNIEYKGKNHGLVFLIDWSSSMSKILSDVILQTLDLVLFCRKNNIPFEVYFFRNCSFNAKIGLNELELDSFQLVNCLNSQMKLRQFDLAFDILYDMAKTRKLSPYSLTGTPLNSSLTAMPKIILDFKTKNKLDCVSFIVLSDGDSNSNAIKLEFYNYKPTTHVLKTKKHGLIPFQTISEQTSYPNVTGLTAALIQKIKKETGVNTICFYLTENMYEISNKFSNFQKNDPTAFEKKKQQFNIKNFCIMNNCLGYDKFFVIKPLQNIEKESNELKTLDSLAANKSKRIILSEFIDIICKNQ